MYSVTISRSRKGWHCPLPQGWKRRAFYQVDYPLAFIFPGPGTELLKVSVPLALHCCASWSEKSFHKWRRVSFVIRCLQKAQKLLKTATTPQRTSLLSCRKHSVFFISNTVIHITENSENRKIRAKIFSGKGWLASVQFHVHFVLMYSCIHFHIYRLYICINLVIWTLYFILF